LTFKKFSVLLPTVISILPSPGPLPRSRTHARTQHHSFRINPKRGPAGSILVHSRPSFYLPTNQPTHQCNKLHPYPPSQKSRVLLVFGVRAINKEEMKSTYSAICSYMKTLLPIAILCVCSDSEGSFILYSRPTPRRYTVTWVGKVINVALPLPLRFLISV
jgi:hypothetical protein